MRTASFALKKAAALAVTLALASALTFAAFNVLPGDPASLILGAEASAEQVAALRAQLGLDVPAGERYLRWVGGLFSGDAGDSIRLKRPVAGLIAARLPVTLTAAGMALVLAALIALPAAVFAAARRGKFADAAARGVSAVLVSCPEFLTGSCLILLFGGVSRLFVPGRFVSWGESPAGFLAYMFFPAVTLALPSAAVLFGFLRSSLLEQLNSVYFRAARARGASFGYALTRHALKNALVPAVTALGMAAAAALGGSVIAERVFTVPGLGSLMLDAVTSRDLPLAQTLTLCLAAAAVAANAAAETAVFLLDKRVKP